MTTSITTTRTRAHVLADQHQLLLSAAKAAQILGPHSADDVMAVLLGSPRWLALEGELDRMEGRL